MWAEPQMDPHRLRLVGEIGGMTAEPQLALPRPAQSGRVSSHDPPASTAIPHARQDWRASSGHERTAAGSGQPPAPSRRYGQFAFDDPFPSGRILDAKWTRTPAIGHHRGAKTTTNCRQALCRTRTDDPFLTMEGSGLHERSRMLTGGHELPANRRSMSERPRRPEYGRGETGGRNVDGKPAALHRRISRANLGLTRLIAGGPLGPPDAIEQSSITWLAWRSALRGGRGERSRSLAR